MSAKILLADWLRVARTEIAQNLQELAIRLEDYAVCYQLFLSGLSKALLTETELLQHLVSEDGRFPAVADIAPTAILGNCFIFAVMPSGHAWVSEAELTWGGVEKGPFKACPWSLPNPVLKGGRPTVDSFLENGQRLDITLQGN